MATPANSTPVQQPVVSRLPQQGGAHASPRGAPPAQSTGQARPQAGREQPTTFVQAVPQRKDRKRRVGYPPAALWWVLLGVGLGVYVGWTHSRLTNMRDNWQILVGNQRSLEQTMSGYKEIMTKLGITLDDELKRRGGR